MTYSSIVVRLDNRKESVVAFQNLKSEFVRHGIKQYEVADFLGMTNSNFNKKLSETIPTTRDEMFAIQKEFLPEFSIDYLFESDGNVPAERERLHAQADTLREVIDVSDEDMEKIHKTLDKSIA